MAESKQGPPHRSLMVIVAVAFLALIGARTVWPERSMTALGPVALWDHFFTLALAAFVTLAAYGLGALLLKRLQLGLSYRCPEYVLFSCATGLGGLGVLLFGMGVVGLFRPLPIVGLIGLTLLAGRRHWANALPRIPSVTRRVICRFRGASPMGKLAYGMIAAALGSSLLHALTPPWSFDALMYHLEAPQRYLEAGRLLLLPDIWQANGPMGIELLYAIGLAFGSATFARVVHWLLTALLMLGAYCLARRLLGEREAEIAAIVIAAIPILPVWGSIANIDSGWALFESLAIYAIVVWASARKAGWLRLAAVFTGLNLTTKYLALAGALTAGAIALAAALMHRQRSRRGVLEFALLAALIGAPWYLFNLARVGNPTYPFIWGGPQWDPERLGYLMTYLRSFGAENKLVSLVLAPIWLYTRRGLYTTFMSGIEFPSLLFPLIALIPLTRPTKGVRWLGAAVLLRFMLWGAGSQQTRFLLPLFPALAVLSAQVLGRWMASERWRTIGFVLPMSMLGTALVMTFLLQGLFWWMVRPGAALAGLESKESFLRRNSAVYPAQQFIQSELPADVRVLMLWDGQSFYCDERCIPDAEQSQWTQIIDRAGSIDAIAADLQSRGVTHLLGNIDSLNFFLRHDPKGNHTRAAYFYLETFRPRCAEVVFTSEQAVVDRLICP